MGASRLANTLVILIASVAILVYTKDLLIPLVLAIIAWLLIRGVKHFLNKWSLIRNSMPAWSINLLAPLIILSVLGLMVSMLVANIKSLSQSMPSYERNIQVMANQINQAFDIDLLAQLTQMITKLDFSSILSAVFASLTDVFGNAFTILLYLVFMLLEESVSQKKLLALYKDEQRQQEVSSLLGRIESSIIDYLLLKTLVSLITGALSYVALLFIGVEAALFWAFLIFALNYIPTIGSLIATAFPAVFALLQFGQWLPPVLVIAIVGAIQLGVGNIIEPKIMGNSLNISPLVVLIALASWGAVWGITGMLLCVPITVIMVIVFAKFENTRFLAILLSEKGELEPN